MPELNLIQIQFEESNLLNPLTSGIASIINLPIKLTSSEYTLEPFYNVERDQFDAGQIISHFDNIYANFKTVIHTSVDLYLPIFTYVFGLAQMGGRIAIISTHRLKNQYYGLPADDDLLKERLLKETVHEIGHLFNLRHCPNYRCVMTSSTSTDDLDVKSDQYCFNCASKFSG